MNHPNLTDNPLPRGVLGWTIGKLVIEGWRAPARRARLYKAASMPPIMIEDDDASDSPDALDVRRIHVFHHSFFGNEGTSRAVNRTPPETATDYVYHARPISTYFSSKPAPAAIAPAAATAAAVLIRFTSSHDAMQIALWCDGSYCQESG
ncbi:hypothetical protein B0H65DRAFT_441119 [Neurospora tetraspora]|uniref:Uncharacterized protein n=1 Tax=Neurospora tetraspora TaxID=94610 RepID=A0AAE0MSC3_9PEZI|nr:hypothetical protein B0H65DRAFT_441119 [Neurospora tetraspora]